MSAYHINPNCHNEDDSTTGGDGGGSEIVPQPTDTGMPCTLQQPVGIRCRTNASLQVMEDRNCIDKLGSGSTLINSRLSEPSYSLRACVFETDVCAFS